MHRSSISRSAAAAEGRDPHGRRQPKAAIGQRPRSTAAEGTPCHGAFAICPSTCRLRLMPRFPHFGPVFLDTGAAAMSGRFSATPPPWKRSSRPSLLLYLDFPRMSPLTLAACDHFSLSRPPLFRYEYERGARLRRRQRRRRRRRLRSVLVWACMYGCCWRVRADGRRRRRRARVSGTHGIVCLRTSSRLVVGPWLCMCASFDPIPLSSSSSVLSYRSVVRSRFGSRGRGQSALLCCVRPCCGAQATAARSALFSFGVCGCGAF